MMMIVLLLLTTLNFLSSSRRNDEYREFFDSLITPEFREQFGISMLGISVIHKDQVGQYFGYGFENPGKHTPTTNRTVSGIASISKTFLTLSFIKVFGIENLNKNLNNYLPKSLQYKNDIVGNYTSQNGKPVYHVDSTSLEYNITFRNMLTHTTGYDEVLENLGFPWPDKLETDIELHLPNRVRKPGVISAYNNYPLNVLGWLIERYNEEGLKYGDFLKTHIFDVLEMRHSYYEFKNAQFDNNFCKMDILEKNGEYIPYEPNLQNIGGRPSGAIYSSHLDMQKYTQMLLDHGRALGISEPEFRALFSPHFEMGNLPPINMIFYDNDIYEETFKGHAGSIPPFYSRLFINFEKDVGLYFSMSAKSRGFVDGVLEKFTLQFLKPKGYCSGSSRVLRNDTCYARYKLSEHWNKQMNRSDYKYKTGCFITSRHTHTNWMKILFYWMIRDNSFCVDLYDDTYLVLHEGGEQNDRPILLLENVFVNQSRRGEQDYLQAEFVDDYYVEIKLTSASQYVFKKTGEKQRYWVRGEIFGTFEWIANSYGVFDSQWKLVLQFPISVGILEIVFLSLFICSHVCCIGRVFKRKKSWKNKGYDVINEPNVMPITSGNENERGKFHATLLLVELFVQFFFFISVVLALLHYIFVFRIAVQVNQLDYEPYYLMLSTPNIILCSCIFLSIAIVVVVFWEIFQCLKFINGCCNPKDTTERWILIGESILYTVGFLVEIAIMYELVMYYELCYFYNVLVHK